MDLDDGNIDIILRISYMLASSLRREDADNFLAIYDTIIPKGFSNKKVDNIKEKARDLAELPEEEFSKIGVELGLCDTDAEMSKSQQAFMNSISRTSQGSSTMDSDVSKHASPVALSSDNSSSASSMEDSDSRNGAYWDYCSPSSLSDASPSSAKDKVTVHNPDKVPVKKDKVVVHNPLDDERLKEVFDYCPDKYDLCEVVVDPRKPTHYEDKNNQIRKQNEMSYDDVYNVEEEDPRKVAKTIVYTHFNENACRLNSIQYDESHPVDDNMPGEKVNPHWQLYGMRSHFTAMRNEDTDEASPSSSPRRNIVYTGIGRGIRPSTQKVDQRIDFIGGNILPRASEGTEINSECYPKTERLLGSSEFAPRSYGSLEEGCGRRTVEDASVINNNIDAKKKKKKKKPGKDDSGGKVERNTTNKESMDVNGNPVIGKSNSNSENKLQPPQPRPQFTKINGPISSDHRDYPEDRNEDLNRDSMPSASDNGVARRKKKKDSPLQKAGSLFPNNCGDKSVDDLLQFIENSDNVSKRKKEKSKTNQNSVSSGSINDKTACKKVRKGRSSSLTDSPKESEVGSEHGEDTSSRVSEGSELKDVSSEPAQSEVSSIDMNHKMPTSPIPVSPPTDEGPLADIDFHSYNDNYIFTDKDIAAITDKDNDFQVVCKKKKPKSTGPVTSSSSHREHYDHHFNHFTREYHRHVPVARSVTPPPKSSSRPDKRERAFSPSAFPELGGNTRGCEGRRNSTGNVQVEISPDDSDLESVKSLPTGTCNDLLSTCPVISYAKIAAKPRQMNGIGLVAPALSSKAAGEEKMTGEDPQHPPVDVSPPASQSPELPTLNDFPASNNCDLQASCRSISKAKTPTVSLQERDLPASNQVVASSRDATPICNSGNIFAKDNNNKFDLEFVGESHIQSNDEGSSGGQSNSTACSRGGGIENTLTCFASELRPAVSGSMDIKASSNNAQCNVQNVSKPVENNHKKSTVCSVIFMDRPAQALGGLVSPSPKIDISFGFDDPCDANFRYKVDKGKVIPRKANGLILPSPPQGSPGLTFLGPETDFVSDHTPEGQVVPSAAGEPSPVAPLQSEPAHARDGLPSALAGLHPITVPEHLYDPRNDCANFALEDTVYFIRKEWDRLAELAQRNPNKVIIYSCD